ncbi:hypothetical protein J2S41_001502 [Catenuloplanes atrovinosus]|uniref:Uncharacterized protein n=1 Tax=Catenuloplanes atrovinosus TaxID=137266 RepID=A0AAE4C9E4_9ACTN|nr:hypothetical protein [Catenuloplanes atrovinosus]
MIGNSTLLRSTLDQVSNIVRIQIIRKGSVPRNYTRASIHMFVENMLPTVLLSTPQITAVGIMN